MKKRLFLFLIFWVYSWCTSLMAQEYVVKNRVIESLYLPESSFLIKHSSEELSMMIPCDKLMYIRTPNIHLNNPALRYAVGNLELSESEDIRLNDAVDILLDYVRNDSIRNMVNYIKDYIKITSKREIALKKVKQKLRLDSIDFETNTLLLKRPSIESYYNKTYNSEDLKKLVSFVERDSVFMWMREVSRDSVLLSIKNSTNDSINLWINSGKVDFYRFWIKNSYKDSIGAWIQTIPGKSLKIVVDDDVYQESLLAEKKKPRKVLISKKIDDEYWKLGKIYPHKRILKYWKHGTIANLGFTQGHLENWSGGGESAISGLLDIDAAVNYKNGNITWDNKAGYRYGLIKIGDEDGFRKNEDLFELETKLGVKAFRKWYYSAMFSLKTQFFNGYNYPDKETPISAFLSPGYMIFSAGMDYKPSDKLTLLISPITGKFTIVSDTNKIDQTRYGVEKGKKLKQETGAYIQSTHKWQISSNIKMINEAGLFTNYHDHPENIDINWKMTVEMKVNYFIVTKIFTHLIYDTDVLSKLQFKEILNFGVSYRF